MPFRILLAEDNPADANLVAECLEDWGRTIDLVHVTDGMAATKQLMGSWRPDLVILDLKMPNRGGLEVLEHMKQDPGLKVIPVIVLTSSADPVDVRAAYERYANTYFQKPMRFEDYQRLMQLIERYWADLALAV